MSKFRAPYLIQKRGIYYLQKRIPKQLTGHYGFSFIRKSLRTTDRSEAVRLASNLFARLEREWNEMLFSVPNHSSVFDFLTKQPVPEPVLSEARLFYCEIQWLFPLDEVSRSVSGAPVLSQTDIQLIHINSDAQANIRRSAAWFLGFLERNDQWRTKYNHNHLRITRMVKSLRLLTDDKEADEFKAAVFDLLGDDLDLIDRKAVEFWEEA